MQNYITITPEYLQSQGLSLNFPQRFFAKVQKTDSCWLWTGCTNKDGYGCIGDAGGKATTTIKSPRASWILHFGPIPEGMKVLHNCPNGDNPSCVNPAHLWLGTNKDNSIDASSKCKKSRGKYWNTSKLTPEQVEEIKRLFAMGTFLKKELAIKFGVNPSHISRIISGHAWNITGPNRSSTQ